MLKKFVLFSFVAVIVSILFVAGATAWQPEFKERDIEEAKKVADDPGSEPDLVPTEDDEPVLSTTYFEFDEVEARYVRIVIYECNTGLEVRIDEIEIYGGYYSVNPQSKSATFWGQIKTQY